jgi:hypothetical protein
MLYCRVRSISTEGLVAAGVALLAIGCSHTVNLTYEPVAGFANTAVTMVDLTVVDNRPPGYGGDDKTDVGRLRGSFGEPVPLYENGPDRVRQLVQQATADALMQARVGTKRDSPRRLIAHVTGFWMDGFIGYKGVVEVDVELMNERDEVLWKHSIKGAGGGSAVAKLPSSVAPQVFGNALRDYVQKAAGVFNSEEFQELLF